MPPPDSRRSAALLALVLGACASPPVAPEMVVPAAEPVDGASAEMDPGFMRAPRPLDEDGIFYVLGANPSHPRVRYLDGQLSQNDSCAIRLENKLNRRIPPVYVNGRPVGFC